MHITNPHRTSNPGIDQHVGLVVATSRTSSPTELPRWLHEAGTDFRALSIATAASSVFGFPELSYHRIPRSLPVLRGALAAADYARSLRGYANCGHPRDEAAVLTIRLATMDDGTHWLGETCEEHACPPRACVARALVDCEACARQPSIEPNLKRCEWCRQDGVKATALAAVATGGVVVLTSQCDGCVARARRAFPASRIST